MVVNSASRDSNFKEVFVSKISAINMKVILVFVKLALMAIFCLTEIVSLIITFVSMETFIKAVSLVKLVIK